MRARLDQKAADARDHAAWKSRRFADVLETMRSELRPTEAEAPLALAKMRMALANMRGGMRVMPILAILCAAIHLKWADPLAIAAWLAVFMASLALRVRSESWLPAPGAPVDEVRRAVVRYAGCALLFMTSWAAQGFLFWKTGDSNNHLIIAILMLTSAMSAILTAPWLLNPFLQVIIYIGGIGLLFVIEGTPQGAILGVLALLYANMIVAAILHINKSAERLLVLESEKDDLIDGLRQADRAKSEFLANMSHELRTPLNAILGFSEVMKDEVMGPMSNKAYKSYAGDIHSSGQHLLGLVNDILDLAKIESGKLELNDDSFTMTAIVDEGLRLFQMQADQKGVKLVRMVDPAIMLRWDLRAAKQIAINLLSNALKFTPEGGTITVTSGMRDSGGCYVTVKDSGAGIAEEDRQIIFESFGQGQHDIATTAKGTGLGLAIVKALVELLGGAIHLESTAGDGAAFTIEVPAERVTRTPGVRSAA